MAKRKKAAAAAAAKQMDRPTKAGRRSGNRRQPRRAERPTPYQTFARAIKGAREVVFPDGLRVYAEAITYKEAALLVEKASKGLLIREGDRVIVK